MRISDWSSDVCSSDLDHFVHGLWTRPQMQCYRFRLGDHSSPTIADRRRIVHDVLDDLGARRAQDGVRHLVYDGIHGIFNDRERHGINRYGHTDSELISMTILPIASACALAPGGTIIVEIGRAHV